MSALWQRQFDEIIPFAINGLSDKKALMAAVSAVHKSESGKPGSETQSRR